MKYLLLCSCVLLCMLPFPLRGDEQGDHFARTITMPEGSRYAGEDLDLSKARNVWALEQEDIKVFFGADAQERPGRFVANVRHNDRFWVAHIPEEGVARVVFQFQTLSALARRGVPNPVLGWLRMGHVQVRFAMQHDKQISLVCQLGSGEHVALDEILYSVFAVRPILRAEVPYQPLGDGMLSGYGLAHTFQSMSQLVAAYGGQGMEVEQYEMNLGTRRGESASIRMARLLDTYMEMSLSRTEDHIYNTLVDSCVSETMAGLYRVVPNRPVLWYGRIWRNWRLIPQVFGSTFEYNPRAVTALLRKQGYIRQRLPDLHVEFPEAF